MKVGVLALQGDFREHTETLKKLGVHVIHVKLPSDIESIDRLIIPGGESMTIGKLLKEYKLLQPIRKRIKNGMPVWGTCAGAILMAKHVEGGTENQPRLGVMNISAHRNAFGRQLGSFETRVMIKRASKKPIRALFIRAPLFKALGKGVEVLAKLSDGGIVAAREKNMLVTSFHTELTGSTELHRYFLSL